MKKKLFCSECGKLLLVGLIQDKKIVECSCGVIHEIKNNFSFSERVEKVEIGEGVLENEKEQGFPHNCKKCGYDQSDVQDLGASYSDESNVYLFKCKKCGYVTRQADGTGNN